MEFIIGGLVLVLIALVAMGHMLADKNTVLRTKNQELENNMRGLQAQMDIIQESLDDERIKNADILSQKKSSETRLGMISEHLVPMLANFPYNPEDAHFLGQPVDYIIYDLDQGKIVFLEVKSGNSKLSRRQKIIKNIIQQGRVFYEEIRINEKGIKVKHNSDSNNQS